MMFDENSTELKVWKRFRRRRKRSRKEKKKNNNLPGLYALNFRNCSATHPGRLGSVPVAWICFHLFWLLPVQGIDNSASGDFTYSSEPVYTTWIYTVKSSVALLVPHLCVPCAVHFRVEENKYAVYVKGEAKSVKLKSSNCRALYYLITMFEYLITLYFMLSITV